MNAYQLAQLQQNLAAARTSSNPTAWNQRAGMRQQLNGTLNEINDYRNPAVWQQVQQATANMNVAQKYLYAQAHHIPAAAFGMPVQTINYLAQSLMGFTMDRNSGQIMQQNGDGSNTVVPSNFLGSAVMSRNGADLAQTGGMRLDSSTGSNYGAGSQQWRSDEANSLGYGYNGTGNSNYGMNPGDTVSWRNQANGGDGYGNPANPGGASAPGSAGSAVSNLGGGTGNPNNAAGDPSLAGAGGNSLRQQFMDSQQFNPNGANTYAIQNMNLTGQGALGSNMGGVPSNGTYPSQTTAVGNGSTSGAVMPDNGGYGSGSDSTNAAMASAGTGTANPYATSAANQAQQAMGAMTPQTSPYGTRTPRYFNSTNTAPTPATAAPTYSSAGTGTGLRNGMVRQ